MTIVESPTYLLDPYTFVEVGVFFQEMIKLLLIIIFLLKIIINFLYLNDMINETFYF